MHEKWNTDDFGDISFFNGDHLRILNVYSGTFSNLYFPRALKTKSNTFLKLQ